MLYLFLFYNLLILYLALHFKKKKYFSNYSGDSDQIFSNKKDIPLVGGIFLIMPILSISYHIYFYSLMTISILILGLLSDQKILSSAKKRFLFQIILILFSVVCLDLKILSSRIIKTKIVTRDRQLSSQRLKRMLSARETGESLLPDKEILSSI